MVEGLIDLNGARGNAGAIATYLEAARFTMADVDGDGVAGALTDTQVVTRFFLARAAGKTEAEIRADTSLIAGVVNPAGTRVTQEAIVDHLFLHLPSGSASSSALAEPVSEERASPTGEILEPTAPPTMVPAPEAKPEKVTKPGRRKGHEKRQERLFKRRR